jgi:hypothetical protein
VRTDGTVACWGNNYYGKATPPDGTFLQVSAGGDYSCGVTTDGTIVCWGGDANRKHVPPPTGSFTQVSASDWHACGLDIDGRVACWGAGWGSAAYMPTDRFQQVVAGRTSGSYVCGLRRDGTLACWGILAR